MPSYLLIVNPVAGNGAGANRAEVLRAALALRHEVELVATVGRGHATELARTRGGDVDRVIAVGGDGTLNEVLTGLMELGDSAESRPALGYLAGGTANVATAAFGFETDPELLAGALPGMTGRPVDVGVVDVGGGTRPFLLWCGAGLDAVVIDTLNSSRTGTMGLAGLAKNMARVLSAVREYPCPAVRIAVDGRELDPAASLILANVGQIAFGGTIHPTASAFDGALDVITIVDASPLGLISATTRMMTGSLTSSRRVRHTMGNTVVARGDGEVPVQIDGEPVGHLPISVRLASGAVRLLVDQPVDVD